MQYKQYTWFKQYRQFKYNVGAVSHAADKLGYQASLQSRGNLYTMA